jgi:hypothetical protein
MRNSCHLSAQDDNLGADLRAIVEVSDIGVGHADASGGDGIADGLGLVRTMDPVHRRAEIQGAGAEGMPRPPFMECGKSGLRRNIAAGGLQSGHSRFMLTVLVPDQVKPDRRTPTPY